MSGWLSNGLPLVGTFTGNEQLTIDTQAASGASPETAAISLSQLAAELLYLTNSTSKTMVSGTRYYSSFVLGSSVTSASRLITGVQVLVGGTGGTDNWLVELHDVNGVLLATSATAGVLVGTANRWQQIAFTAAYQAAPGTYYIAIQGNGTTATLATYNSPTSPLTTGSATGVFGTGANFTPPTTTPYTAALGPVAGLYT